MSTPDQNTASPMPGRINRTLIRMFMKPAEVAKIEDLAPGFRLITLHSPAFRHVQWVPGQKMQIAMGSAFVARTYTPIDWDNAAGRTRIITCAHGHGPGSTWASQIKPGDVCDVFGPRSSLNLGRAHIHTVLVGDETSLGLACALEWQHPDVARHTLLEVESLAGTGSVLHRLALKHVELFGRVAGDLHLDQIERRLSTFVASDATFVLTGNARSIQRQRHALRALGVNSARLMTKAYWALGKTGLD